MLSVPQHSFRILYIQIRYSGNIPTYYRVTQNFSLKGLLLLVELSESFNHMADLLDFPKVET
jgi:hypothetical protein